MGYITAAQVVSFTDKLVAMSTVALGTNASGYGIGDTSDTSRAYFKMTDTSTGLESIRRAFADPDIEQYFIATMSTLKAKQPSLYNRSITPLVVSLKQACVASMLNLGQNSSTSVDLFAKYYNIGAGGPWNCLFAPGWYTLHNDTVGSYPSPYNTYFEVVQGSTYTNGMYKVTCNSTSGGSSPTDGFAIDSTKYAGCFPYIRTSSVTGGGLVTVAGTWRKTDGTTASGNGTITLTSTPANNAYALTSLPFTNALLLDVTGITLATTLTGGTIYVESKAPSGRLAAPS
jgi:hypothetical protein